MFRLFITQKSQVSVSLALYYKNLKNLRRIDYFVSLHPVNAKVAQLVELQAGCAQFCFLVFKNETFMFRLLI
jgi:hypothetical protein